jgi:hypothetical protein
MSLFSHKSALGFAFPLLLSPVMAQEVTVAGGKVAGLSMADGSSVFYGIPYAAAPVGANRPRPARRLMSAGTIASWPVPRKTA